MTEDEDRAKYFGIEIEEYLKWKKDAGKDLPRTEDKHLLYRATKLYYNLYREDEKDYNYYPKIAYLEKDLTLLDEELKKCFLADRSELRDMHKEIIDEHMKSIKKIINNIKG